MSDIKFKISLELYQQKRYEVAKDILASVMNRESLDADPKQRENILYHCVQLADGLMEEIGYFTEHKDLPAATAKSEVLKEQSKIHKLKDILNSVDEK